LADLCKGLADPKRLRLLAALREGERSVGELAELLGLTQPSVSHHLGVLRSKGIVAVRRSGTKTFYRPSDIRIIEALDRICGWMIGEEPLRHLPSRPHQQPPPPPRKS